MKSVITCDMEGRILTMNDDAEKILSVNQAITYIDNKK